MPSHYLIQCWHIVNYSPRNIFQWNFIWNSNIFIPENAFELVVCEMAAILSRGRGVKGVKSLSEWKAQFSTRRLHSLSLAAVGPSVRYEAWSHLEIGWSRYRMGFPQSQWIMDSCDHILEATHSLLAQYYWPAFAYSPGCARGLWTSLHFHRIPVCKYHGHLSTAHWTPLFPHTVTRVFIKIEVTLHSGQSDHRITIQFTVKSLI